MGEGHQRQGVIMYCKIADYRVLKDIVGISEGTNTHPISVEIQMEEVPFGDKSFASDILDFGCNLTFEEAKAVADIILRHADLIQQQGATEPLQLRTCFPTAEILPLYSDLYILFSEESDARDLADNILDLLSP